jgi:hypothetical protein
MSINLDKPLYYVYKTGSTGFDKYYIGRRKSKHDDPMKDNYFGSGNWVKKVKDKSRLFKVVLAVFDNLEDCKTEEQRLLDIHVGLPDNMNILCSSDGGSIAGENHPLRGKTGRKHTEETKVKQSVAQSGANGSNAKLTDAKVILIRELWATSDYLQKELASKFGVDHRTISAIITRKTWKHI